MNEKAYPYIFVLIILGLMFGLWFMRIHIPFILDRQAPLPSTPPTL